MQGTGHMSGNDGPYAPAGLICTVSFISPERNAAIAFACPTASRPVKYPGLNATYHALKRHGETHQ